MAPREIFQEIDDRIISGRGIVALPQDSDWRWFRIWVRVFRLPTVNFVSAKWNPDRSEYAKLTFMRNDYVWKEEVVSYVQQTFDHAVKEPAAFIAPYLACAQEDLNSSLNQILTILGAPPPPPTDVIYVEPVNLNIDTLRFVCREDVGLQVKLFGLRFDVACPAGALAPKDNLLPGTVEPDVTPGTAIVVSDPYDPPDDSGNTVPATGDDFAPQPPDSCLPVTVNISFKFTFNANTFVETRFGVTPAKVVVVDFGGSANITFQYSTCSGSTLVEEFNVISAVSSIGPVTNPVYEFVNSDNPAVPVEFATP